MPNKLSELAVLFPRRGPEGFEWNKLKLARAGEQRPESGGTVASPSRYTRQGPLSTVGSSEHRWAHIEHISLDSLLLWVQRGTKDDASQIINILSNYLQGRNKTRNNNKLQEGFIL